MSVSLVKLVQLTACLASNLAMRESVSTGDTAAGGKHAEAAKIKEDKETILVDCLELLCPVE